jgi:hypothetical protein
MGKEPFMRQPANQMCIPDSATELEFEVFNLVTKLRKEFCQKLGELALSLLLNEKVTSLSMFLQYLVLILHKHGKLDFPTVDDLTRRMNRLTAHDCMLISKYISGELPANSAVVEMLFEIMEITLFTVDHPEQICKKLSSLLADDFHLIAIIKDCASKIYHEWQEPAVVLDGLPPTTRRKVIFEDVVVCSREKLLEQLQVERSRNSLFKMKYALGLLISALS